MRNIKRYSSYYDSGEEWLGELPVGWKLVKTKHLFKLITEPAPVGNNEQLLSVYTALGVRPRKELEERGNKASTTDNYWFVKKGDIIVNKLLAWMGAIGISNYDGVTSPAYDILRAKDGVNPRYYNYLFRSPFASREFKRHSRGIMDMRLRLYFNRLGDIKLPSPPLDQQNAIVAFLNFKLEKIDRFIQKKRELIATLSEQRAAIIGQVISKGLDKNSAMKESGIEWIGKIPAHWELWKLGRAYKHFGSGTTPSSGMNSYYENGTIPWVNTGDLNDGILKGCDKKITEQAFSDYSVLKIFPRGTLSVAMYGASIGKISILDFEATTNQACCNFYGTDLLLDEYTFYWFLANKSNIVSLGYGGTQPNISQHLIRSLKITVPPIKEQRLIIEHITQSVAAITTTIQKIENEIALISEYKKSIILEAVLGRLDVSNYTIPKDEIYSRPCDEVNDELFLDPEDISTYEIAEDA